MNCRACDEPTGTAFTVPVDTLGRTVHNGFQGASSEITVCHGCYSVHAAGGPAALEEHVRATTSMRSRLFTAERRLVLAESHLAAVQEYLSASTVGLGDIRERIGMERY